jgi:hypothetical protein
VKVNMLLEMTMQALIVAAVVTETEAAAEQDK